MKRILLITLMFYGLHTISFSQEYEYVPFPDSGAIWSEMYSPSNDMDPAIYERFTVTGEDTIMNSKTYKKLYIFHDTIFDESKDSCVGGIREDNQKRIFYKGNIIHNGKPDSYSQNEILLYDFSLSVGDTFVSKNCMPNGYAILRSIDTLQIKNMLRKKYQLSTGRTWIEGIGNAQGLLFSSGEIPTGGYSGFLICFKLNNEIIFYPDTFYFGDCNCMPVLNSIEPTTNNFSILVFPNPINNKTLLFNFKENKYETIEIFDCNGILAKSFFIRGKSNFIFSTAKLQHGIYFYKVTNFEGAIHTGKFVVQ